MYMLYRRCGASIRSGRMSRALLVCVAVWAWSVGAQGKEQAWEARVTYVSDGDTLWVRPVGETAARKIRLDGVDAPEICQAFGPQAHERLAAKLSGRTVRVRVRLRDDYQRLLARIELDGEDIGAWLVREGWAWSYRYRDDPGPYAAEEAAARLARRGLFARADAVRPRTFRQRHGPCY